MPKKIDINKRVRDTQKKKLYNWEEKHLKDNEEAHKSISFEECKIFIKQVCQDYKIEYPIILPGNYEIKDRVARSYKSKSDGNWYITLPMWSRTKLTCLHETCHMIIFQNRQGSWFPAHSSVFLRLYIELLINYLDYNPVLLRRSVVESRMKVASDIRTLLWV
jgi:hypothetical protein